MNTINIEDFKDKVLGCWTGKNIGGTLGAPFEGNQEINNLTFYSQDLKGNPEPNDDLDLQLIWLRAIEEHGLNNITAQLLGEYWLAHINGPWNEYGVAKTNMRAGLLPPMSGSCNNERWKSSNGAWIRSEVWACCFPGEPDKAIEYAYKDACVDHYEEGIYAEMFTAALQSAAFVVSDINELIAIGLSKIPEDCRITKSVRIAIDGYKNGKGWLETREAIVKDSSDLGWFQAPANIGFSVLGLLYGEGDFGKSICLTVNCGDDTDCTGATVGAILGIIGGRKAIPEKWLEPIGDSIQTICINCFLVVPKTLTKLADRVVTEALKGKNCLASLISINEKPSSISSEYREQLKNVEAAVKLRALSPYELSFELPQMQVIIDYIDGPQIASGETKKIRVKLKHKLNMYEHLFSTSWRLPEGWEIDPGKTSCYYVGGGDMPAECLFSITPEHLDGGFQYVELVIKDAKRMNQSVLTIPFQCKGTVRNSHYNCEKI
jgi:ADP-ribosylglycohydrolase